MHCWWSEGGFYLNCDVAAPTHHPEGSVFLGIRPGGYQGSIQTFCISRRILSESVIAALPPEGQVKEVSVHTLWGIAKGTKDYNKRFWADLADRMGE